MLDSSFVYTIARTIPESLVVIILGIILLGKKIDKKLILKNGMFFGIVVTLIRRLPISFGVHTILGMIVFGLIMFRFSNKEIIKTIITTCIVFLALALSESIYVVIVTVFLGIRIDYLMDKSTLSGALITLPSLIIAIIIVLLVKKIKKKIENSLVKGKE